MSAPVHLVELTNTHSMPLMRVAAKLALSSDKRPPLQRVELLLSGDSLVVQATNGHVAISTSLPLAAAPDLVGTHWLVDAKRVRDLSNIWTQMDRPPHLELRHEAHPKAPFTDLKLGRHLLRLTPFDPSFPTIATVLVQLERCHERFDLPPLGPRALGSLCEAFSDMPIAFRFHAGRDKTDVVKVLVETFWSRPSLPLTTVALAPVLT